MGTKRHKTKCSASAKDGPWMGGWGLREKKTAVKCILLQLRTFGRELDISRYSKITVNLQRQIIEGDYAGELCCF